MTDYNLPGVNMNITDKQGLEWLVERFNMTDDSFRHSLLYKLLKNELTKRNYWKAKPRGKPQLSNLI